MKNKFGLFTVASLTACIVPGMALAAVLASESTNAVKVNCGSDI